MTASSRKKQQQRFRALPAPSAPHRVDFARGLYAACVRAGGVSASVHTPRQKPFFLTEYRVRSTGHQIRNRNVDTGWISCLGKGPSYTTTSITAPEINTFPMKLSPHFLVLLVASDYSTWLVLYQKT